MPAIKHIRPGQMPRAIEWNALADRYNGGALGFRGYNRDGDHDRGIVRAKNNSGADRSRFECMALGAPSITLTTDGQVDLIFTLDTADPNDEPAILIEPIANGQIGRVIIDGPALALIDTAASAAYRRATANAAGHNLTADDSGPILLLAAPDTGAESLRPVVLGRELGGSGATKIITTAAGGISANAGSSASCDVMEIGGGGGLTDTGANIDVWNPYTIAIPGSFVTTASQETEGDRWVVAPPAIINLRLSGNDLQYTLDGTNWTTWTTGTTCA